MEAVVNLTEEKEKVYLETLANLKEKLIPKGTYGFSTNALFDDYSQKSGYAHYNFSGTVKPELIEKLGRQPTDIEIIMIVDGGFSHFGASCSYDAKSGRFSGHVNTD